MKQVIFFLYLLLVPLLSGAQSQWRFHIAFEDATGAKDTIWMVYDTTAHFSMPIDTLLNEGATQIDNSIFNVFVLNPNSDTTKTSALPYSEYPYFGIEIYGINYVHPMTISWDTALFRSPVLPNFPFDHINKAYMSNDYFFFVNNDPFSHQFNMTLDNSVSAPSFSWQPMTHFPLSIAFSYQHVSIKSIVQKESKVYPTIVSSYFYVRNPGSLIRSIDIIHIDGKIIKTENLDGKEIERIDLYDLSNGVYFISFTSKDSNTKHNLDLEKIIKY
jgi:hypothetical protein